MPAERRLSTVAHARASGHRTTVNYISGGRGGPGGDGYGNGTGGAGGPGMGPSLNFDILAGNFTMHNLQQEGERGIEILHRAVALEAIHDSAESFPQPKCHPETRTRMLENLRAWVLDKNAQHNIMWLHGPAGAGKSAIMQTLCGDLEAAGRLGGSFFFKRGHATRDNAKTLFATIAYQLALAFPWLRTSISQIVENDPSIAVRSIATQMKTLIYGPCRAHLHHDSVTILIDGLDECDGQNIQMEILRAIRESPFTHPVPFRFIVASRPEPHIREMFDSPLYAGGYRSFNVEQSFDDVRNYLRNELLRIHHEHFTMKSVASPWPSPDVLTRLVRNSSGHFIYAATVVKFIDDKNYRPTERLAVILNGGLGSESAYDALDQLYATILTSAARRAELVPVLCAITNFDLRVTEIDQLLGLADGEAHLLLRGLHSVLQVPSQDNQWSFISSHHASFLDFLNNSSRSQNFYVGGLDPRMNLARRFLQLCASQRYRQALSMLSPPRCPERHLMPFLTSLPPSSELCPLIARMEPDHISPRTMAKILKSCGPGSKEFPLCRRT
ncbi:hypothetical protein C8R45DRAFT_201374 [Mycena sanguinolenta]|nr:hypothetical protein C8R45DRAFT_201374 [Mycena sanguinolenta]